MVLNLYWKDIDRNSYEIAKLDKNNSKYILYINEENLKSAIKKGCLGIGNVNFLMSKYESKDLFPFFKNRIPNQNHPEIKNILEQYGLTEYDDMKLLKATGGKLRTDRYYIE